MADKEYIEREALIRYAEKQRIIIKDGTSVAEAMRIQGNVFRRCVETCPAADVVPREECEKWYHEYHKIKDELRQEKEYHRATEKAADKYFADLQTAKADVAREIFEEIETLIGHTAFADCWSEGGFKSDIAELKKKYTEETYGKQA